MAAYAALVSLVNDLELIPNHPTHSFSFDDRQIASLSQTVHFLIDFVESYDSHGCSGEAAQVLKRRIASAAHAAHDVIESHVVDQILPRKSRSYFLKTVKGKAMQFGSILFGKSTSYLKPIVERNYPFLLDLQKSIDDMDFVKREAIQFKAMSGSKAKQPSYSAPTSAEPLTLGKNDMVGFDDASLRLLDILTGEPAFSRRVIPMVGMGGIGKSTLAKSVYEDPLIHHHFHVRLWATISQQYSLETILTQLLFTTAGNVVDELGVELRKMLWGRRYLIVLDDMWSVEAWNEIQMFLPDNRNGSRVIVTTRLSNLAAHLGSSSFAMNFLEDDKSWQLFCRKALGEEDCPIELEEIGKRIVYKCGGLPLSIVVIGGHLRRSSRAIGYWEKVANYMNPISSIGADEQCLKIINLSYDHLPAHLKPCFLHMGIFPEDSWPNSFTLLAYWVGEGFVKAKEGVSLEEVAKDYLKDLIDRNLIIVGERYWNGNPKHCGIHDVVRELCLKVGKKKKFLCVVDSDNITKGGIGCREHRRIVIPEGKELDSDMVGALQSSTPLLRSLMHGDGLHPHFDDDELSVESRLLRVSAFVNNVLVKKDGRCFPASHFQQLNLRFLAFSCKKHSSTSGFTKRPYLPSSISLFWNLQTLIIRNDDGVQITAPYEIWEMSQLTHLQIDGGVCLPDPLLNEQECIVLQNLHTLARVYNLRLTEEVCKRMPNIKVLSLRYDNFPVDCEASSYYCLHNIGRFNKLEIFKCDLGGDSKYCRDVLLSIRFPSSLKELFLQNCNLYWEDIAMMIKSLPRLGCLILDSVRGPEWSLVEEEFSHLKALSLFRCEDLKYWNANSSHFPVLEILEIYRTSILSEISSIIEEIPSLTLITLHVLSDAAAFAVPTMKIVEEQESLGNHDLQFKVRFEEMKELEVFQKIVQEMEGPKNNSIHLYYKEHKFKTF